MKKILIFCGHPDDDAIALGGTIRKFTDEGAEITEVIFATGNEGYSRREDKDKIIQIRAKEREAAGKLLGIARYETFGYTDYGIPANEETYKLAIRMIRKYRPDMIFTHYWLDYMAHKALATVVTEAWWQAGWEASLELGEPWKAGSLYYFEVLQSLPEVSHVVDITNTFQTKVAALKCYASQHSVVAGMLQHAEGLAKLRGNMIGVQYGEGLLASNFVQKRIDSVEQL